MKITLKKVQPKDRYVLGKGYPRGIGLNPHTSVGLTVGLTDHPMGVNLVELKFPEELWAVDVPQYRLVLERVK